jgi:hypothetical protein
VAFKSTDFKGHILNFVKRGLMKKIISVEELKKESEYDDKKGMTEFFILLNFNLRSSKRITYYPDKNTFDVHNEIDDSYEEDITEEQLISETHIGAAIKNGAFYKYDL